MNIDTSIVKEYLARNCEYKHHWVFKSIDNTGTYLFDCPAAEDEKDVQDALKDTLEVLENFCPCNLELFQKLFPQWRVLCNSVNVILAVGCPEPYDAMVRIHDEREFIIIDLIRLLDYKKDIREIILPFFTHELTHICIHADYPNLLTAKDYQSKLEGIVFDEGFAHLLSFQNNIQDIDFTPFIQSHYKQSLLKLKSAVCETDAKKQLEYLREANSGEYWKKYGAICGELYLARHMSIIEAIYKAGPKKLFDAILQEEDHCEISSCYCI